MIVMNVIDAVIHVDTFCNSHEYMVRLIRTFELGREFNFESFHWLVQNGILGAQSLVMTWTLISTAESISRGTMNRLNNSFTSSDSLIT